MNRLWRVAVIVTICCAAAKAAIPASERAVLVNLYNSTNGAGWTNKTNWNGEVGTECTWFGVVCVADHVNGIYLYNNQLAGTIPALGALTNLQFLSLEVNQLKGSIPSLTELTSLKQVGLARNQLTGSIPSLSGLPNLNSIFLSNNQLTGPVPPAPPGLYPNFSALCPNHLTPSVDAAWDKATGSTPWSAGCNTLASEREVLVSLYNSTNGAGWTKKTNWNGSVGSECTWFGITCVDDRVTAVALGSNHLVGTIPSLTGLANLQTIGLENNQLSGSISSLSGMANLQTIRLDSNQLTGSIPSLKELTNVRFFNFAANQLTGPIPSLSGMANLQTISLDGNQLSGSIPSFIGLASLYIVNLSGNQLSGPVPSLAGLTNLFLFYVNNNQLTGSIPALTGLPSLQYIRFGGNQLTGSIPTAPANLLAGQSSLCPNALTVSTDTVWDKATGSTPWSSACTPIPAAERAVLISFYNSTNGSAWANKAGWNGPAGTECGWYGVTCDSTSHVRGIQLSNNNLSGPIPPLINLTKLSSFFVGFNQLSGPVPAVPPSLVLAAITGPPGIVLPATASLCPNNLTFSVNTDWDKTTKYSPWTSGCNTIPTSERDALVNFYNSTNGAAWKGITFPSNPWNGPSGSECVWYGVTCSANHITGIVLFDWNLTGSIPSLTGLTGLQTVNLNLNKLNGPIPSLAGLANLSSLSLYDNQLSGPIPDLTGLTNLNYLDLGHNQLTGAIPPLAGLKSLSYLALFGNQLTGSIPPLTGLTKLSIVFLDANNLTGPVPSFAGLASLGTFSAPYNQLSGTIPPLTGLANLGYLLLDNNVLTGSIPTLAGLTNLRQLRVRNNQLTGSIPPLTGLAIEELSVGNNKLSGAVPTAPAKLLAGQSSLCPNALTLAADPAWDKATGVTPWAAACTAPPQPSINRATALYTTSTTIQPGAWFSISGTNLADTTTLWNGDFATNLGGASVTVNGKPAYLLYVSPSFMNVQAPDDTALGFVEVKVTTAAGTGTASAYLATAAPSFNLLDDKHIAGILLRPDDSGEQGGGTYDIVGPTGTSLGYKTVAAKAGDTLLLYGVGFGPTTPAVPAGKSFVGAAKAQMPIQFVINGHTLIPDFAGIAAAGQFQFNLTIPAGLGIGDQPLQATVNGVSTPTGVVLALQ
ncbi:MAG: hypothetical protein ABI824_01715 [Acidobacteriota bacterium]